MIINIVYWIQIGNNIGGYYMHIKQWFLHVGTKSKQKLICMHQFCSLNLLALVWL